MVHLTSYSLPAKPSVQPCGGDCGYEGCCFASSTSDQAHECPIFLQVVTWEAGGGMEAVKVAAIDEGSGCTKTEESGESLNFRYDLPNSC